MNKEIIKAMNRKEKKQAFRKWWNKNGYKVMRVILFPIWVVIWAYEKIINWLNNRQKWNEKRANEILNYYIPRKASWVENEKEFYFFDNGLVGQFILLKNISKEKTADFGKFMQVDGVTKFVNI